MSVASAAAFIRHVRSNETVARQLRELGVAATYDTLCAIGYSAGFKFGADELATAFRFEWTARSIYYAKRVRGGS